MNTATVPSSGGHIRRLKQMRTKSEDVSMKRERSELRCRRRSSWCNSDGSGGIDIPAPNAIAFIEQFNQMSFWVAQEILRADTDEERKLQQQRALEIAEHCLRMQNLHSCLALVAGILLTPVMRLKHLKDARREADFAQAFKKLESLLSSRSNYARYRQQFKLCMRSGNPCVPFMAVVFKDLFVLQDGRHPKGKVDFRQLKRAAAVIYQIHTCQLTDFYDTIPIDKELNDFLREAIDCPVDEKALSERSTDLQPSTYRTTLSKTAVVSAATV